MSQLQLLKTATSLSDIADLVQFKTSALAYILYKKLPQTNYYSFEILKRGGGSRQINAPSKDLMLVQRRLADILQNCVDEINQAQNRKDQLAHGFKRKRSIITNATKHRKRRYVFNIDLQDFFGTINFGRVRGFFLKDRNFALGTAAATILAQIACYKHSLPQGSPCSPVISNLVGNVLDLHLSRLSFRAGCTYSRYADDITFSTNKRAFPSSIAKQVDRDKHKWEIGDELQEIVSHAGFKINSDKTRMQYRDSRQNVTGLVVNSKVNIRSEYRRTVRAMAHRLFMTGSFEHIQMVPNIAGALQQAKKEGTLLQLHGMLGHIDRVDQHNLETHVDKFNDEKETEQISSKEHLYRRFLLFKEFYVAPIPVIICEGKTDNVYLKQAIRSLGANYPSLATIAPNGTIVRNVRIFKYPNTSTGRILHLKGGTGDLKNLIDLYRTAVTKFKAPGMQNPLILVIDYDDGAKKIKSLVEQITKVKITGAETFTRVFANLYLITTPLNQGKNQSCIEDSFTEQTRGVILNNKMFDLDNEYDTSTHYGKHTFSEYVEKNSNTIDFTGFREILARIEQVISTHKNLIVKPN